MGVVRSDLTFDVAGRDLSGSQFSSTFESRIVHIVKPADGQAVKVELGFDQSAKLDLSAIANDKITLVHVGENLIILFDNSATITVHPFFNSMGVPLQKLSVDVSPGRTLSGTDFASVFPITTDQSVLPASGEAAALRLASGANFTSAEVDPLSTPNPLPLLPPEELPNWQVHFETVPLLPLEEDEPPPNGLPSLAPIAQVRLDDDDLPGGIAGGVGDDPNAPLNASGVLCMISGRTVLARCCCLVPRFPLAFPLW